MSPCVTRQRHRQDIRLCRGRPYPGPGTGTSDSIPIMASNGEYVINAKATRKHLPLLEAINSGKAPAFATGGRIGASLSNTYAPAST